MKYKSLKTALLDFANNNHEESGLGIEFENLAMQFLYGGYIQVNDISGNEVYRVYIHTIEFYFHSEKKDGVKDYIVYHRNGNAGIFGDVPYYPLMSFNTHGAGIDITFESEEKEFRASALIRAYEVYDVKNKLFLKFGTVDAGNQSDRMFRPFENSDKTTVNNQSTYIYFIINGFRSDNPLWIDKPCCNIPNNIVRNRRINVHKYDEQGNRLSDYDERQWQFSRITPVGRETEDCLYD